MKTDFEIQKDVMDELTWQPLLSASQIGVAVKNGIVTLTGTVDSYLEKIVAEDAAKKVTGVKAVAEDIEVKLKGSKKNDTEIAEAVMFSLRWHSSIDENKIKIKVENGWVTLDGSVTWNFQKVAIRSAIAKLEGVKGITNNLQVNPIVRLDDVKNRINAAFHRSATIDSDNIHLSVTGSTVTLSGTVRSYAEKKDAESAAWLAPGVIKVVNLLEINQKVFA